MAIPSILVVDDEPENFEVIEALLSQEDYQLHYADSGEDILISLNVFRPDLILLDVMMPSIDGIEVCRQIKAIAQWRPIPVIMVTALNAKSDLARCLEAGADDFISKPLNALEFRARVHSMLRLKAQHDLLEKLSKKISKQKQKIETFSSLQRNRINVLQQGLESIRGCLTVSLPKLLISPAQDIQSSLEQLQLCIAENELDALKKSQKIDKAVQKAQKSADRLKALTQRILFYRQLESMAQGTSEKHFPSATTRCHAKVLIEAAVTSKVKRYRRSQDLELDLIEARLPIHEQLLTWVVNELVDNACKFSDPGTPIKVRSQVQNERFHLQISDRGHGMAQYQIANIGAFMQFDQPFDQPFKPKSVERTGLGLGLIIARKITDSLGGQLLISSVRDQGTTVDISLSLKSSLKPFS